MPKSPDIRSRLPRSTSRPESGPTGIWTARYASTAPGVRSRILLPSRYYMRRTISNSMDRKGQAMMPQTLPKLLISEPLFLEIRALICQTAEGLETGVTLFGTRLDECSVALFAVGPGAKATHLPGFHEPDAEYINRKFDELKKSHPGLEWIGSLHVHPFGMPGLSGHDRRTVRVLLYDNVLKLADFIAGIIQRRGPCILIYPYWFSAGDCQAHSAPLEIVSEDADVVCQARAVVSELRGSSSEEQKTIDGQPTRNNLARHHLVHISQM